MAFISAKSLSVTTIDDIKWPRIRHFRLSKHQLKLSSRSASKYAKATEKVISVLVIPTIAINDNQYMLVLYAQFIINTRENACNNSILTGWAQRISLTVSIYGQLQWTSIYACYESLFISCCIRDLLVHSTTLNFFLAL